MERRKAVAEAISLVRHKLQMPSQSMCLRPTGIKEIGCARRILGSGTALGQYSPSHAEPEHGVCARDGVSKGLPGNARCCRLPQAS